MRIKTVQKDNADNDYVLLYIVMLHVVYIETAIAFLLPHKQERHDFATHSYIYFVKIVYFAIWCTLYTSQ